MNSQNFFKQLFFGLAQVLAVFVVILFMLVDPSLLYGLLKLTFGWLEFLSFNIPRVEINFGFIIEAIICLIILFSIIQLVGKKIITMWKWQWTAISIISPLLLFVLAIASIGIVQSYGFFMKNLIDALNR